MISTSILAFIAGLVCKLHDDISDNKALKSLRHNKYLTEFLKGAHYVSFTMISLLEPIFFFIFYLSVVLNYISDNITGKTLYDGMAYVNPYDFTVFFSFAIIFLGINYSELHYYLSEISIYDILLILLVYGFMIFEPFLKGILGEVSLLKLITRINATIVGFIMYYLCTSNMAKTLIGYIIGYFSCSSVVQFYSLYLSKNNNDDKPIKKDKSKDKKKRKKKDIKITPKTI